VPLRSKDLVVLLSGIVEIALGLGLAFWKKGTVTFGWVRYSSSFWCFRQYCVTKDAFGALNSDNSRLIRLFSNRCLLLGPYGQLVRLKPGETTKLKLYERRSIKIKQSNLLSIPLPFNY
jgi:hypothetical protein